MVLGFGASCLHSPDTMCLGHSMLDDWIFQSTHRARSETDADDELLSCCVVKHGKKVRFELA